MDFFDKPILSVLRDGRSRDFQQILGKVSFSHNTLRLHLRASSGSGFDSEGENVLKRAGKTQVHLFCTSKASSPSL